MGVVHDVYLGIGSNMGDRHAHLAGAREALAYLPNSELMVFSDIYETEPIGPIEQGAFLNAAAWLRTRLSPNVLLSHLQDMEKQAGRLAENQRIKWGPRPLDLDILLYGNLILNALHLRVPHPWMHRRRFVLMPLAQIAPEVRHPVMGKTMTQLLVELEQAESEGEADV